MQKLAIVLMILMSFFTQNSFGQKTRSDFKGHIIDSKGDVYLEGTKIGSVTREGLIKDANGQKIAFVNTNGSLLDVNGKNLGKMGKDGKTYYDANGLVVFSVNDVDGVTCDILDAKGKKIGNVHDSYKGVACSLHCFTNKMDMKTHSKKK